MINCLLLWFQWDLFLKLCFRELYSNSIKKKKRKATYFTQWFHSLKLQNWHPVFNDHPIAKCVVSFLRFYSILPQCTRKHLGITKCLPSSLRWLGFCTKDSCNTEKEFSTTKMFRPAKWEPKTGAANYILKAQMQPCNFHFYFQKMPCMCA